MTTRTVRLLTWPEYISPESLHQFEAEYAVKVELDLVPNTAELVERMLRNSANVDVVVPPDYAIRELEAHHRLDVLDHARLTNLRHLEIQFRRERPHDPGSRMSVVKDWGTTGFMFRTDVIQGKPTSWSDFWNLAEAHTGRVTVLDSQLEVIGAALKLRGHSQNSTSPDELRAARAELLRLKPHLLAFETDYKRLLASGKAVLALGWSGDAARLKAQGVPVHYVIPKEGAQVWEYDWAIPRRAPDPGTAHLFINFMLRPDVAAQEARYTHYATANRTALALLGDELRGDPGIYPPPDDLIRLERIRPIDADGAARRAALWKEIRG